MAKTLPAYKGGTWYPAKGVQAYVGGSWKPAKSVRRYSAGVWTSVLDTALTIINDGTAAAPHLTAQPAIPSLVQTYEWWYYAPKPSVPGQITTQEFTWQQSASTTVSITPAIPSATKWRAVAVQYDGVRVTSNELEVTAKPTATVTMAVPLYCLATITPNVNNNVIVNPTLTATVSIGSEVKLVKLQGKHSSASVYTDLYSWTTKTTTFSTAAVQFTVDGLWSIRAELTRIDDSVVYSNIAQMTCVKRTITVTASDLSPEANKETTTLTATLSSEPPAGFPNTSLGWDYKSTADWVDWNSAVTPRTWAPTSTTPVEFRWSEQFPDGSKLYSNSVKVSPTLSTVITGTGGTNVTLQGLLDQGFTKSLPVRLTGTWTIDSRVYIPPNARVDATGATFVSTTASQMFSNSGNGNAKNTTTGATGYNKGGGWIWTGGTFNANNQSSTAFSLVHCPRFTIQDTTIYNTMAHGIEINSSGGAPNSKGVAAMTDADFTVQILDNQFLGVDGARDGADLDEAIHWDYAWIDSNGKEASTAGSGNDGTICNNILIKGNTIKKTRTNSYSVAIGHHHSISDTAGGRALPDSQHRNIKITNNTIMDVRPVSTGNERGAIHIHSGTMQVYITSNNFVRCSIPITMEPRTIPSGWAKSTYYRINSNTFNACGYAANYPWITGMSKGAGGSQWYDVSVWNNTFTGAIPAAQTAYMIKFVDTTTLNITYNKFWGLTGGGGSPLLSAKDGNRIYGSPSSLPQGVTGMTLSNNTWCARADGVGNVSDNS